MAAAAARAGAAVAVVARGLAAAKVGTPGLRAARTRWCAPRTARRGVRGTSWTTATAACVVLLPPSATLEEVQAIGPQARVEGRHGPPAEVDADGPLAEAEAEADAEDADVPIYLAPFPRASAPPPRQNPLVYLAPFPRASAPQPRQNPLPPLPPLPPLAPLPPLQPLPPVSAGLSGHGLARWTCVGDKHRCSLPPCSMQSCCQTAGLSESAPKWVIAVH
mmetsp:Transcript_99945/g.268444  ORF Transcript_99945/g.268444 Transcript_99945/m.268444 type:complete len:220 (-) Transcript_99945:36-695(-)